MGQPEIGFGPMRSGDQPELMTPMVNYRDRESHFIFGDVATAVIMERAETCTSENSYDILGTKAETIFSNNIRSGFGHVARATDEDPYGWDKLFNQKGRKVFEEVSPLAAQHMKDHLASLEYFPRRRKTILAPPGQCQHEQHGDEASFRRNPPD
jgi:beta-ketodecanoyl-[acyl-carrier-protein] synthase